MTFSTAVKVLTTATLLLSRLVASQQQEQKQNRQLRTHEQIIKQRGRELDSVLGLTGMASTTEMKTVGIEQSPSGNSSIRRDEYDPSITGLRFIVHIGPLKTGTTSLQGYVKNLQRSGHLESDNWYIPEMEYTFVDGTVIEKGIETIKAYKPDEAELYLNQLENDIGRVVQKTNANIFLSNEYYSFVMHSPDHYKRLKEIVVDRYGYQLEIVAGYRPYFEFVRSTWYQTNQIEHGLGILDAEQGAPWINPKKPGKFNKIYGIPKIIEKLENPSRFTNDAIEQATPYVTKVHILDLHQTPTNYIETMVCDILQATTSCPVVHDQLASKESKNGSSNIRIRADVIGMAAAANGWIDIAKYRRHDVMVDILQYITDTLGMTGSHDLPMDCGEVEEKHAYRFLLEHTLEVDRLSLASSQYNPESPQYNPNRINDISVMFQEHVDDQLYCAVDTTALFDSNPIFVTYLKEKYST